MRCFFWVVLVVSVPIFATAAFGAVLDNDAYEIPLDRGFRLHKSWVDENNPPCLPNLCLPGERFSDFNSGVRQLAVSGTHVVGTCDAGYFVVSVWPDDPARTFADAGEWKAELKRLGIPEDIRLQTPEELAAPIADRVVHPQRYSVMHGLLGQSDTALAGIGFLVGCALMFCLGFFVASRSQHLLIAVGIGLPIGIGVMEDTMGGGFLLFPLCFYGIARVGRYIRRRVQADRNRDVLQPLVQPLD